MTDNSDNLILLFQHEPGWMTVVRFLEDNHIPLTREHFLKVAYAGDPPEWSAEVEDDLPPSIRDDTRTFGHPTDPPPSWRRGFFNLTPKEWDESERWN
jgi:hypothetical protein